MNRLTLCCAGSIALAALAAMSLGAGGCSTDLIIDGSGGTGGQAATSTAVTTTGGTTTGEMSTGGVTTGGMTTGGGGSGGGPAATSIALLDGQITQVSTEQQKQWLTVGETLDATTLIVLIGDQPESCGAPVFDFGTVNHHLALIGLPQALQKVGKYDIATTDVIAFGSSWLSDGMGNGGGGQFTLQSGTVEVLSIDASSIEVRLEGLTSDFTGLNGDHLVMICPSGV